MSHATRMLQKIEELIQLSRGMSLDEADSEMLKSSMQRLNDHFHIVARKRPPHWPDGYLQLEADYCRVAIMQKRREFNDIWNSTHTEIFRIQDEWGRD